MPTSLANAINFRSLSDQLTKQEFKQFLNKIVDSNKRQLRHLINTSLFNYFIEQNTQNNNNSNDLNDINSILSNIIQSRKQKPKLPSKTNVKLNQLPQSIIGYISCFMDQFDYFEFEKTNRSIFIGCNSPNMLTILRLYVNSYSPINLSKYHSVRKLHMHLPLFSQFILPNNGQIIMPRLNELALYGEEKNDFDIEPFMRSNCFNFQNIKSLRLVGFGDPDDINSNKLYQLLTKFPNIEGIELANVFVSSDFKASKLKQLCPNLNGLSITGGDSRINNDLIDSFGNNLHFLTYDDDRDINVSNVNFAKLRQVMLNDVNVKMLNDVMQTAKHIQQFALFPHCDMKAQQLKTIISQILKCKSLQYLGIEANNENFATILNGIENGLYQTIKYERKSIRIRINTQENFKININDKILNIGKIIHLLESSNINDFMFILDMIGIDEEFEEEMNVNEILNDLNNISSNIQIQLEDELIFVITNKNCKINGYEGTWVVWHDWYEWFDDDEK